MFKNYFKTAWRNISNHKIFSVINIGGLAIGIAAVLMIALYIQNELSYDNFHTNGKNIYRAAFDVLRKNKELLGTTESFVGAFATDAKNELSGIDDVCRVSSYNTVSLSSGDKKLKVENVNYADSGFFNIFSFKLIAGNPSTALKTPYSIVLDENTAQKMFGNKNPVGEVISLNGKSNYTITGIVKNAPTNSHIQYAAIVSFATLYKDSSVDMGWNGGNQFATYLLTKNPQHLLAQFPNFMWRHLNKDLLEKRGLKINASLQPLAKIHLNYSDNSETLKSNIRIFSIVALLILIISCINYINLSVAQSSSRFKEVGVKKVLGANKPALIKQFLTESFFVTLMAALIGLVLINAFMPAYNQLFNENVVISKQFFISMFLLLLLIVTVISIGAGGYLSLYLSSFNVINLFKKSIPKTGKHIFSRVLIVFQFTVATVLITVTLIITLQISFVKAKPVGFDKDKIVVLPLVSHEAEDKAMLLKPQLLNVTGIESVSAVSGMPYDGSIETNGFIPEGTKDVMMFHEVDVDADFLKLFHVDLVNGDFFSADKKTDSSGYVINEALARRLNWVNPIGKTIERNGVHKVIGVIKDFNFASLHDNIEPLIITVKPWQNRYGYLAVRYTGNQPSTILQRCKSIWNENISADAFDYWFLDTAFNSLYKSEQKFQQLFFYFSLLSIMLSLAGVFGLVLLTLQQKTKEIGIRKVLGAGVADIVRLTAQKYVYMILIAFVIAMPVAWIYTNKWLQSFAYRINIQWWMFVIPALVVLIFALTVISLQTIKAANANPVKSLKTE